MTLNNMKLKILIIVTDTQGFFVQLMKFLCQAPQAVPQCVHHAGRAPAALLLAGCQQHRFFRNEVSAPPFQRIEKKRLFSVFCCTNVRFFRILLIYDFISQTKKCLFNINQKPFRCVVIFQSIKMFEKLLYKHK